MELMRRFSAFHGFFPLATLLLGSATGFAADVTFATQENQRAFSEAMRKQLRPAAPGAAQVQAPRVSEAVRDAVRSEKSRMAQEPRSTPQAEKSRRKALRGNSPFEEGSSLPKKTRAPSPF